jgi:hypothetical protein
MSKALISVVVLASTLATRSLVQARIAKLQLLEFRLGPGCRLAHQCVHSKSESKRDPPKVYKRSAMSLKVNALFRARRLGHGDLYNAMH